jgi:hypothetical protein
MKLNTLHGFVALLSLGLFALPANACPFCQSETADKVWTGIFNDDFGYHLFASLAPFPVLLGVLLLIYYGPPNSIYKRLGMKSPHDKPKCQYSYPDAKESHE